MKYLLIESYYFEIASLDPDLRMTYSLSQMLEPLQSIQGIKLAYIRVLRCDYWDLVQSTERMMCDGSTVKRPNIPDKLVEGPSKGKETMVETSNESNYIEDLDESDSEDETQEAESIDIPDSEDAQELFKVLCTKPLYRNTKFVRKVKDGMPEDGTESLSWLADA